MSVIDTLITDRTATDITEARRIRDKSWRWGFPASPRKSVAHGLVE